MLSVALPECTEAQGGGCFWDCYRNTRARYGASGRYDDAMANRAMNAEEMKVLLRLHGYDPERIASAVVTKQGLMLSTDGEATPIRRYWITFDYQNDDGLWEAHDMMLGYLPE